MSQLKYKMMRQQATTEKNYNYFISLINKRSSWFVMLWIGCPRLAIDCRWRWLASLIIQLMKPNTFSYIWVWKRECVRARSSFFWQKKDREKIDCISNLKRNKSCNRFANEFQQKARLFALFLYVENWKFCWSGERDLFGANDLIGNLIICCCCNLPFPLKSKDVKMKVKIMSA